MFLLQEFHSKLLTVQGTPKSPHPWSAYISKWPWTLEAEQAFVKLKVALQSSPTLGLPDPLKPFTKTVDERNGCTTSVLLQHLGDRLHPVAYSSAKLDPVAAGLPRCLWAVSAAEKAFLASHDIVGYSNVVLLVSHAVSLILQNKKVSHLSAMRYARYHSALLDVPNVTVKRCTTLNPNSLLLLPGYGEEHNCLVELQETWTPQPDMKDTPLTNHDLVLFVDGSASCDITTGHAHVGFAVVTDTCCVFCLCPTSLFCPGSWTDCSHWIIQICNW